MLDAVSDERLPQVALLSFDEALLAVWGEQMPAALRALVEHFQTPSTTAQKLLGDGTYQAAQLEQLLRELAAYGVITGVWDVHGADLLALARRRRGSGPVTGSDLPASPRGELPPVAHGTLEPAPVTEGDAHSEIVATVAVEEPLAGGVDQLPPSAANDVQLQPRAASVPPALPAPASTPIAEVAPLTAARESALSRLRGAPRDALRLALTLAALAALGYVGGRLLESPRRSEVTAKRAPPAPAARGSHETSLRSGTDPGLALGTVLPYIDTSRGVAVGSDEGLLVFEYHGSGSAPAVEIDHHPLQAPPLALALPASSHELRLRRGDETTIYTLIVRAGETRIISLP